VLEQFFKAHSFGEPGVRTGWAVQPLLHLLLGAAKHIEGMQGRIRLCPGGAGPSPL
jgi:hypothetical protein